MNPKVSIVILNWNGWKDTIECLESLYSITYPYYDIIVVENGSDDDSIQKIKEYCNGTIKVESRYVEYNPNNKPIEVTECTRKETETKNAEMKEEIPDSQKSRVTLIRNEKNYGFAEGSNIGMKYALNVLAPQYILLLNNDTVVDPHFLNELVKTAQADDTIAVVGPKIYYYEEPNRIHFGGGKINWWIGKPIHCQIGTFDEKKDTTRNVEFLTGCCMLLNPEVKNIFFDAGYFAYFEDADLCVRLQKEGYKLVYAPSAKIWHKISQSLEIRSEFHSYYFARNRTIFMREHGTFLHKIWFYPFQIVAKSIGSFFYFGIRYRKLGLVAAFIRGIRDGLRYEKGDRSAI
jgi:GT2 family glycosyltransferase